MRDESGEQVTSNSRIMFDPDGLVLTHADKITISGVLWSIIKIQSDKAWNIEIKYVYLARTVVQ